MNRWFPDFLRGGLPQRASVWWWAAVVLLGSPAARFEAGAATFTVANLNDSGPGSLRQAILDANAAPGLDTILFQIPGAAPHIIRPLTALPPLLDPVVIDGATQPDYAGTPTVQLVGTAAGPSSGLRLFAGSDGSTVRGLAINRFGDFGIRIDSSGSNVVQANFLGTDATGAVAGNGNGGVMVLNASGNLIGGTNAAQRNVLSGGNNYGVYLQGASSGNTVAGNFIGTTAAGTNALGNVTGGVVIYGAPSNLIGGTTPGAGNVIAGNAGGGVLISTAAATANQVQGNWIGTDRTGRLALGNGASGVKIDGAAGNLIGGTNAAAGNVIAANGEAGVFLNGAVSNSVQGNFIGTDATGTNALGNAFAGVTLADADGNLIGGPPGAGNVISGNQQDGVFVSTNSAGNQFAGNLIGLDATGARALANQFDGIALNNAPSNYISGNVISGNVDYGVWILGANASGNVIQGNTIGLDATAGVARGNQLSGVRLESPANLIGGPDAADRNIISGNARDGITLVGAAATGNVVQGNFIGTDLGGAAALPNLRGGIGLSGAADNLIGGAEPGAGNVISGNGSAGIWLVGYSAASNLIQGNRIGTDATGMFGLGNALEGIYLETAVSNVIGGSTTGNGNVISANGTRGIYLNAAGWTRIQGNFLGTAIDGLSALGNGYNTSGGGGFSTIDLLGATNNLIGGSTTGAGNRIAYAPAVTGAFYAGVRVRSANNGFPVSPVDSTNNAILGNAIFANGGLGIDIGPYGVTADASCTSVSGGNRLQNFPVLADAASGINTRVRGSLTSLPNQSYRVQFFSNPACQATGIGRGYGEGQVFLGEAIIAANSTCTNSFTAILPVAVPPGYVITATASNPYNNTSEFSACLPVSPLPMLTFTLVGGTQIAFSWTNSVTGLTLVETTSLTPPVQWVPVTNTPTDVNGQFVVIRSVSDADRFYALMFEVPAPPLPTLDLAPAGDQQVALSWTNTATRFALEEATNLAPPIQWSPVTNTPAVVNGQFVVTVPGTNSSRFYRLGFQ